MNVGDRVASAWDGGRVRVRPLTRRCRGRLVDAPPIAAMPRPDWRPGPVIDSSSSSPGGLVSLRVSAHGCRGGRAPSCITHALSIVSRHLDSIPEAVRLTVAELIARSIEHAAAFGEDRWGTTPFDDGIRLNAGWTEVLTARASRVRLIVDREAAGSVGLPSGVQLIDGDDPRGFYPSVPGSALVELDGDTTSDFSSVVAALGPAHRIAVGLAARRPVSKGVRDGHRQQVVAEIAALVGRRLPGPSGSRGEQGVLRDMELMEGALRRVVGSEYERNATARALCIEHHGSSCAVCGMSFERVYGPLGAGFIHVHHVDPIAASGVRHRVDPVTDLVPVCPNCHAMLHRDDPPMSVEALRALVGQRR